MSLDPLDPVGQKFDDLKMKDGGGGHLKN